jgi:hypothetical protein
MAVLGVGGKIIQIKIGGGAKPAAVENPPNLGFQYQPGYPISSSAPVGAVVQRTGGGAGRYATVPGTTSEMAALPPWQAGQAVTTYEVLRPFQWLEGGVAPAYGQTGFGWQYYLPKALDDLVSEGFLAPPLPVA